MTTLNPWINFNGNTEEALIFYKSALGGVEVPFSASTPDTYFGMFRDRYGIEWVIEYDSSN